jgi:hypothetical protein
LRASERAINPQSIKGEKTNKKGRKAEQETLGKKRAAKQARSTQKPLAFTPPKKISPVSLVDTHAPGFCKSNQAGPRFVLFIYIY